jgi:hypothetical protein
MRYFTGVTAGLADDVTFGMDITTPAEAEGISEHGI